MGAIWVGSDEKPICEAEYMLGGGKSQSGPIITSDGVY